jgi:hypothetical protein
MLIADIVTNVLLFFGILLGPASFVGLMLCYFVKKGAALIAERRQRRFYSSLPCMHCCYFSDCEVLRCAVNPRQVLTVEANDCSEFIPLPIKPAVAWAAKRSKQ